MPALSYTRLLGIALALDVLSTLGCSQTPTCDSPSAVSSVKAQLSQRLASMVHSNRPISVIAFAPTDKGTDPATHVRLCTGIASTAVGAPTVTYTIARSSDGKPAIEISNIEPDQAMRDSALSNSPAARLAADIGNLKQLALAMEEYALDHNGKYPKTFKELTQSHIYLATLPSVPGSGGTYTLLVPPGDTRMGGYEILDDGSIGADASLRTLDGDICDPSLCRDVIFAAGIGLLGGAPSAGTL